MNLTPAQAARMSAIKVTRSRPKPVDMAGGKFTWPDIYAR